jgi:hypothetical protein
MEIEEILREIGLSIEETKIYLTLLKLNSSLASRISDSHWTLAKIYRRKRKLLSPTNV